MLAHVYRYLLFIILGFAADALYVRGFTSAWHHRHLAGIFTPTGNIVNDLAVRIAALVAFHVCYGCAFAYFTTDLHNDVLHPPPLAVQMLSHSL